MRLALDQWRPVTGGRAEGVARLDASAGRAAAAGADLLVLPEMALTGYAIGAEAVAAEAAATPELDAALAAAARRHGLALLAGYPRRDAEGRPVNAVRLVDRTGATVATYAKTHLYGDVDRSQFAPGDRLAPVAELLGWKLGLAICYDIEFPETARALALAGAEAILVPTANMAPFASIATRIVPARAEENAVFLAYANYAGAEADFAYVGLSCVVAPTGADLARAGPGEEMIHATLDRDALAAARANATHLADRRPDLYHALHARPGEPR
ncbi:nitrilase-related carbon-nitrogen hydrolase [Amaricoccus sp.]|uniref:nitrilase-related carbon-nitrogen hydrolase n=1 Tax=Amaricoccus sp. TaxID=1872485 RepID=UPI001B7CD678|nr:nitrilase-related carbon-nitrogen hydrolase [Amaricoccus sp.]MBP7003591.1 hydrolase [Amaricoccus sp.]